MKKSKVLMSIVICALIILGNIGSAFANNSFTDDTAKDSIKKAIEYLHNVQNDDGGFPTREGKDSSGAITSWVIMALSALGEDVNSSDWEIGGKTPIDYLKTSQIELEQTLDYARTLLSLSAAKEEPVYSGENLLNKILAFQQDDGGFYQPDKGEEGMINSHMWSILAIASTNNEIPNKEKAKQWLIERQNEDGGFGWVEGLESDSDDTAIAIQTLILLGENPNTSTAIKKALGFLKTQQQEDGGFRAGDMTGKNSNSASDSWVIQGLVAAGEDPISSDWTINGKNVLTHLMGLQKSDGSFEWKSEKSSLQVQMTAYAIMALKGKPFPVNIDYASYIKDSEKETVFSDLEENHWSYDEIMNLVGANVLSGYPDGTFKPEKTVTRAEFAKLLVHGLNLEDSKYNGTLKFTDISKNHWAYDYIGIGVKEGLISGRTEETFDLNGEISGAEVATMLVRSLPSDKVWNLEKGSFWYSGYVENANKNNLLYPNFNATKSANRAQCAYSIYKLREVLFSE